MGMEEGTRPISRARRSGSSSASPVDFRLFTSSTRREDRAGDVVEDEEALEEVPPVTVTVPPGARPVGEVVPVRLRSHVTEIGTLELECVGREGRAYRLEWNLRQAPGRAGSAGTGAGEAGAAPPA